MNTPNKLSIFRILLVPVLLIVMMFPYGHFNIPVLELEFGTVSISIVNIIALVIFAVASFTDFLDGYLARKHNLVTSFGKFIDPIADKLLVNTMFLLFLVNGWVPALPVILMVARDTIVDGLRMSASNKGKVVAAGYLGKVKTVSQMVTIIFVLLNNWPFELFRFPLTDFLIWFATLTSVVSGISYFMQLKDVILETK